MKHAARFTFATLLLGTITVANAQDTLRIMTYNILNFSGSSSSRLDELRIIMNHEQPELIVFQEVLDQAAVTNILNQVLRPLNPDWEAAAFVDGPDTDNACLYLSSLVTLVSQRQIPTTLRDISEYVFTSPAMGDETFRLYSAHLKASQGSAEEERRREEAQALRNELDELPDNSHFMFCGDFNLYESFEPAYQLLLALGDNPHGRLLDPINRPGQWHNSVSFADIHTQSPRTQSFGGGSTGGMDDRFDFILASAAWMDTVGAHVLPATYHAMGNDGQHFNQAINEGTNEAVPDSVAEALHAAADHLPVVLDVVLRGVSSPVEATPPVAASPLLMHCYPNPFNSSLTVDVQPSARAGVLRVYDLLGREMHTISLMPNVAPQTHHFDFSAYASGPYFVTVKRGDLMNTNRIILQK